MQRQTRDQKKKNEKNSHSQVLRQDDYVDGARYAESCGSHIQQRTTNAAASSSHCSSMVSRDLSQRRMRWSGCWRWVQTGVPNTRQPRPGRLSHSTCSRRRCMRSLTLPLQNRKSLPRSQRVSFGHSRCSWRLCISHETLSLTPV